MSSTYRKHWCQNLALKGLLKDFHKREEKDKKYLVWDSLG